MSLKGISEKIMNDGTTAIMVRFQYQSVTYPIKNFTSLFGCRTKTQAKNKLIEVKSLIAEGKNPFVNSSSTLNIIWENRVDYFTKDKKWNDWIFHFILPPVSLPAFHFFESQTSI